MACLPPRLFKCRAIHSAVSRRAARADRAIRQLVAAPRQALGLIEERVRPLPNVGPKRLGALIASLDSDDLGTREKTSKELASLSAAAEPALRQALAGG